LASDPSLISRLCSATNEEGVTPGRSFCETSGYRLPYLPSFC
jgi:hypothetical protein